MDAEVRTEEDDGRTGGPPRVLGRYQVVAELGRGSTSVVYLGSVAGPGGFSKLFALKLLRPALAEDPKLVAMFLTEARIGAQLNHPNVVATLEIEEGEGRPFIVMEFLDGEPLQKVIAGARMAFMPLPLHMHLAALSGAVEGLAHAHAALAPDGHPLEIVHRDVSPHNVFITRSGMPKVLDFGFAQTVDSPNTMLSSAGRVAYMSPEQADGDPVDARSDLFSAGVMMWEAATRRRFWSEEASKGEILAALRSRELPSHRESALARCSAELRSMVLRSTAADPADRYENAAELLADLRIVLSRVTPPTFALRDLGQRVVNLFAADRARLQRAIDEHREGAYASIADEPEEHPTPVKAQSPAPTPWPPVASMPAPYGTAAPTPSTPRTPAPPSIGASLPPPSARPQAQGQSATPRGTPFPPATSPLTTPTPGSMRPVTPRERVSTPPSEPVPASARNSEPLPSFPIPALDEGREGRTRRAGLALAAIAVAALVLFAVSALRARNGAAESHPSAMTAPATATAPEPAGVPAPPEPPARPSAVSAAPPPAAAEAMPSSGVVRLVDPPAVEPIANVPLRAHHPAPAWAPGRPAPVSGNANAAPPGDSVPSRASNAHADAPVQFSEVPPPRPPHPIDSMNPYGP